MHPYKAQQTLLDFNEAERQQGDRLLKIALETDRVEGYTEPHAILIARWAEMIGSQMGMHGSDLTSIKFAALAHDIGEKVMKRNYLLRHDALTWEETLDLWRHPILGEQEASEQKLSRHVQLLIRWHHEWWDGSGYPDRLSGASIPLGARIIRVVDSYVSLISNRPHRRNYDEDEAEQIIADQAGIEFDPRIVKLMIELLAEERKDREPEVWSAPEEQPSQIVLTPDGLQAAVIPDQVDHLPNLPAETLEEIELSDENLPVDQIEGDEEAVTIALEEPPAEALPEEPPPEQDEEVISEEPPKTE